MRLGWRRAFLSGRLAGAGCALAVIAVLATPGRAAAETPLSAYRSALAGNAGFLAARAGLEAERETPRIAFGQLLPTLSFTGSGIRNDSTAASAHRRSASATTAIPTA